MSEPRAAGGAATDASTSTIDGLAERPRGRLAEGLHWAGVGLLSLILLAALLGWLGPRVGTATATGSGYSLELTYPQMTRAGQPVPLHLKVHHPGGFDGPVQLAISDAFFDDVDFQAWYPAPAAEVGEEGSVVLEFDPPEGDTLDLSLDARTAPGEFGAVDDFEVALVLDGRRVARVPFTVWRMP